VYNVINGVMIKRIMLACVNGVLYDNVGIYTVCCVCTPSLTGVVVVVIV
jgi:hypothetical protein